MHSRPDLRPGRVRSGTKDERDQLIHPPNAQSHGRILSRVRMRRSRPSAMAHTSLLVLAATRDRADPIGCRRGYRVHLEQLPRGFARDAVESLNHEARHGQLGSAGSEQSRQTPRGLGFSRPTPIPMPMPMRLDWIAHI